MTDGVAFLPLRMTIRRRFLSWGHYRRPFVSCAIAPAIVCFVGFILRMLRLLFCFVFFRWPCTSIPSGRLRHKSGRGRFWRGAGRQGGRRVSRLAGALAGRRAREVGSQARQEAVLLLAVYRAGEKDRSSLGQYLPRFDMYEEVCFTARAEKGSSCSRHHGKAWSTQGLC